jgi:uncharacterized protein (TIRG00374 family)
VALAAIALLTRGVRWSDVRLCLRDARPALLVAVVGLNALMMAAKAARLRVLLFPGDATLGACFRALLTSSALNNVLPLRGGDVARLWMLERSANVTKTAAIAASVLERLFDIGALALLAVGASLCLPSQRWALFAAPVVLAGTVCLLVALRKVGRSLGPLNLADRPAHSGWRAKLSQISFRLAHGTAILNRSSLVATAVGLSLAAWAVETTMVITCGKALGLSISTPLAVITLLGINLALALPSTPSNAGPFEASAVAVLTLASLAKPTAVAFALVYHVVQVVPVTLLGFGVLALERTRRAPQRERATTAREERVTAPLGALGRLGQAGAHEVEQG